MDARFDSSRSGYHETAPIMENENAYVIEMVTHTRVEDGGSWNIEDAIIREGLTNLIAVGVCISKAIHDNKNSIDTILRELGIRAQKDLWHKTKKLLQHFKEALEVMKKRVSQVISMLVKTFENLHM